LSNVFFSHLIPITRNKRDTYYDVLAILIHPETIMTVCHAFGKYTCFPITGSWRWQCVSNIFIISVFFLN